MVYVGCYRCCVLLLKRLCESILASCMFLLCVALLRISCSVSILFVVLRFGLSGMTLLVVYDLLDVLC